MSFKTVGPNSSACLLAQFIFFFDKLVILIILEIGRKYIINKF